MKQKLIIVGLILGFIVLSAMNYPSRGTDYSSYRCSGGLVSKGDLVRDVYGKCKDPIRETRIAREPHRVLVYRFGQRGDSFTTSHSSTSGYSAFMRLTACRTIPIVSRRPRHSSILKPST